MEYKIAATRLTLYAFISSIEMDLRTFITENISEENVQILFDETLIARLKSRSGKFEDNVLDLVEYLDFGDCICIINKFKKIFPKSVLFNVEELSEQLNKIVPIRNRVMNSRPLEYEDLPIVIDFVDSINSYKFINWNSTGDIKNKISEDPSSIFGINIPKFNDYTEDKVLNNLPEAEFDDTGFIGRKEERINIKNKLLCSNYPIISLIGDGGIGKTALVLRCLYDIIDQIDQPYEAIIWVSLKTKVLNNGEFNNIKNAITNTIDMYKEIISKLDNKTKFINVDEVIENILEYMKNFKILLVLDNLETINSDTIRNFLGEIPRGSKVVITSRIGIGEFESRINLDGLGKKERVYYLRRLAKNYDVSNLLNLSDKDIDDKICTKLHSNPLAMKWFVINLLKGETIESILGHTEELTNYCMSNVYEKLTEDAKKVLEVLLISNKKCSDAELDYLLEFDSIMHRKALNDLTSTNIVKMESNNSNNEIQTLFYISDFGREYLQQHCKPSNESFITVTKKIRQLNGLYDNMDIQNQINPYDPKSITISHEDEKIAAYYLRQALTYSSKREYTEAFECINKAKNAVPNYFEIYKISGFIYASKGDFYSADNEYRTALECKGDYAPLLYLYSGFKLSFVKDFEGALEYCNLAESLDKDNNDIKLEKARILKSLNKYEEAHKIFYDLLHDEKELRIKYKKITVDQAADNLRDWAIKSINEEDIKKAINLLYDAIDIIEVLNDENKDYKIITTISEIIEAATQTCVKDNVENIEGINLLLFILNKYKNRIIYCNQYTYTQDRIESIFPCISIKNREKLKQYLAKDLKSLVQNIENENEGYLYAKKISYGFIKNRKYESIFLYWKDFNGDFSKISIGQKVEFEVIQNDKGYQAKNVNLIKEFSCCN
ncbi:NB-ARC domain-containing protein [Clostridium thermobutyricum]